MIPRYLTLLVLVVGRHCYVRDVQVMLCWKEPNTTGDDTGDCCIHRRLEMVSNSMEHISCMEPFYM